MDNREWAFCPAENPAHCISIDYRPVSQTTGEFTKGKGGVVGLT